MGSRIENETPLPNHWHTDWLTDLVLSVLLSVAAAWWRLEAYRGGGVLQPLLLPQVWTLLWLLMASILPIILIPVGMGAALHVMGRRRIAAAVLLIGLWGTMAWMAGDMHVHLLTGKHLSFYLPYLVQPDVGEWAGGTDELVKGAVWLAGLCGVVTLSIGAYRWVLRRMLMQWSPRRQRACWIAAMLLLAWIVGGQAYRPVVGAQNDSLSNALVAIEASAAIEQEERIASSAFGLAFSEAMAPMLESMHAQLFTPPPLPAVESLGHDQPPDVIVVVLESWRWTSLSPQYMPRLDALGERGLVAKHHYSTSNRSEFGLFSLLYGRTPSLYEQTLDRSIPPVMCRIFRQWGYESVYVSGLRHAKFNRMEQYIDHPDAFDEVVMLSQRSWAEEIEDVTWPQRDRAVLKYLKSRLEQPDRKPLLGVAFLGATHFPYRYPPEFLLHEPVSPDTEIWSGAMSRETHEERLRNRYMNAAAFLDDEIGRFIGGLDLSRTVVLVTGDHGESIWDDGILAHATKPSEFQCRVPLMAVGRNIPPRRLTAPTNHLDVLPTLLHAVAGQPVSPGAEGEDLLGPEPVERRMLLAFPPPAPGPQELALFLPEGRMLIRLMDRKPVARVLGFVGEDGVVNPNLTPPPQEAEAWVQRWHEALRQRLE